MKGIKIVPNRHYVKVLIVINIIHPLNHPLRYERVYLPLLKVADTPFHV